MMSLKKAVAVYIGATCALVWIGAVLLNKAGEELEQEKVCLAAWLKQHPEHQAEVDKCVLWWHCADQLMSSRGESCN